MTMYTVLVRDKKIGGEMIAYGPYRTLVRAQWIRDLITATSSVDYHDPEFYDVQVTSMRKVIE